MSMHFSTAVLASIVMPVVALVLLIPIVIVMLVVALVLVIPIMIVMLVVALVLVIPIVIVITLRRIGQCQRPRGERQHHGCDDRSLHN